LKAKSTIQKEYARAKRLLSRLHGGTAESEAYGVMQALAWVLGDDAMAPVKSCEQSARFEKAQKEGGTT